MFYNNQYTVVSHAHSSQGKFDEGFTRVHIGRIAGGHRCHRNSYRLGVVRVQPHQGHGTGDYLPEQPAAMGNGNASLCGGSRRSPAARGQVRTARNRSGRFRLSRLVCPTPGANESATLPGHAVAYQSSHPSGKFNLDLSGQFPPLRCESQDKQFVSLLPQ